MNICLNPFESGTEQQIWKHFLITEKKKKKMAKRVKKTRQDYFTYGQVSPVNDSLVKTRHKAWCLGGSAG